MAPRPSKGLADVVAASTAVSDIDGQAGRLFYRGYDIHDLAGKINFAECVHLLQRGTLPTRGELAGLTGELAAGRELTPLVRRNIEPVARVQSPMEALRSYVSLASGEDPDKDSGSPEANLRKAARLTAQQPVLVARYHAARRGVTAPDPDPELGIAGNFLLQITGERPSPRQADILDECLVLHADHTMNASTFAARVCAATLSDMHSAVCAAIGALKGTLHGGANEQVMRTFQAIGTVADVDRTVHEKLAAGEKIMGFGHRVYKSEDPRATHLRRMSAELAETTGDDLWYRMSRRMEDLVFAEKGLRPNVDFYAASVYRYLGIPVDLFTAVFSVSRMAGWTAHVIEQHADNRLIRPDSEYIGDHDMKWVPISERTQGTER
ncbi:citrate/2-methylcitrate synthase [Actinomadura alba]|uniref:Citrate synthase n=1 Tax=Actinomadura alba TaxID=406431 RepID=A0ABR7LIL6_9ACTN|nr:citrate/2-methylcitrate synthase [Actinomadura alba]MBC6464661.1 citrate synthase [Actinomadura alba]